MTNYSIEQALPHSHPMIFVDQLVSFDEKSAVCSLTITKDSHFYETITDSVPSYVGIEYMAQTIAAFAGANALDKSENVKIGFLLGTRKYVPTMAEFNRGEKLLVSISKIYEDDTGLGVFDCEIIINNKSVVRAKVNVFEPDLTDVTME